MAIIITLLCAFVSSNIAWMIYSQRLINKLMSRDFHSYSATKQQEKSPSAKAKAKGADKPKPESFSHPKEDLKILGSQILR